MWTLCLAEDLVEREICTNWCSDFWLEQNQSGEELISLFKEKSVYNVARWWDKGTIGSEDEKNNDLLVLTHLTS